MRNESSVEKFLRKSWLYAFLGFAFMLFIRSIVYLYIADDVNFFGVSGSSELYIYLIIFGACLLLIGLSIWHNFYRMKCAKCKTARIELLGIEEIDRWRTNKKVTEQDRDSKGNVLGSREAHVTVTMVQNIYSYQCRICGYKWDRSETEEL